MLENITSGFSAALLQRAAATQSAGDYTKLTLSQGMRGLVFAMIFSVVLVCNTLALYVLYLRKASRPSAKFTIGLCLENATIGGSLLLFCITSSANAGWSHSQDGPFWCRLLSVIFITHLFISSWLGALISVDRYIAIRKSLWYSSWITNRSCVVLLFSTIALSVGVALIQILDRNEETNSTELSTCILFLPLTSLNWKIYNITIIIMVFVFPLLLNCYVYWTVYRATKNTTALARRNSFQPLSATNSSIEENVAMISEAAVGSNQPARRTSIRKISGQLTVHKDNRKAAKMGTLIVTIQLFVFSPFYIYMFLRTMHYIPTATVLSYDWLVIACLFIDCIANPIVYVLRNKSTRTIMSSICCTKKCNSFSEPTKSRTSIVQTTPSSVLFQPISSHASEDSIQNTY